MNILQRIKEWIIRKLGGTSATYTEYLLDKVTEWHKKYDREHEMLNATIKELNEERQRKADPIEMAKAIKAHCRAQDKCTTCELGSSCKLDNIPCYWELECSDAIN